MPFGALKGLLFMGGFMEHDPFVYFIYPIRFTMLKRAIKSNKVVANPEE